MYCAVDDNKNLIAMHDNKENVINYINRVYKIHGTQLELIRVKKRSEYKLEKFNDLYLTRFNNQYIQVGYMDYAIIMENGIIEDYEFSRDILIRILETRKMSSKNKKNLKKVITFLELLINDDKDYIPSLDELKKVKLDYDPYIYNSGLL